MYKNNEFLEKLKNLEANSNENNLRKSKLSQNNPEIAMSDGNF
jgi:hypothetical protein